MTKINFRLGIAIIFKIKGIHQSFTAVKLINSTSFFQ